MLKRDLGRHRLLTETVLVVAWMSVSAVVVVALTTPNTERSVAAFTLGWLFVGLSGAMVIVILAFGRLAMRRIREGLGDAAEVLRSTELVTDPELSFLPLDELLDELLARTRQVMQATWRPSCSSRAKTGHLTVRAEHGFDDQADAGTRIELGHGSCSARWPPIPSR